MLRRLKQRLERKTSLSTTQSVQRERSDAEYERSEVVAEPSTSTPQELHCEATTPRTEQRRTLLTKQTTKPPDEQTPDAAATVFPADFARQRTDSAFIETSLSASDNPSYASGPPRRATPSSTPSVRLTARCRLHPHTDNAVSATVDRRLPEGKTYLILAATSFHLAVFGRVIVTPGPLQQTAVRLLNLSNRPVQIYAGTVVAVLVPAAPITRLAECNQTDDAVMPNVNFDAIPDYIANGLLTSRLTQYRHLFVRDASRVSSKNRKPLDTASGSSKPIGHDAMHDLPTYLAECRPARNSFPFQTECCTVRSANDDTWHLATSYADRHIPRRFHAVVQLPTELHLPSTAPKARYVSTLTPLHRSAPYAVPPRALDRLLALCTIAFDQLTLPPGYEQSIADLRTHVSTAMEVCAPAIIFSTQDATDPGMKYFKLANEANLRLDADRSFIAAAEPQVLHPLLH